MGVMSLFVFTETHPVAGDPQPHPGETGGRTFASLHVSGLCFIILQWNLNKGNENVLQSSTSLTCLISFISIIKATVLQKSKHFLTYSATDDIWHERSCNVQWRIHSVWEAGVISPVLSLSRWNPDAGKQGACLKDLTQNPAFSHKTVELDCNLFSCSTCDHRGPTHQGSKKKNNNNNTKKTSFRHTMLYSN